MNSSKFKKSGKRSREYQKFLDDFTESKLQKLKEERTPENFVSFLMSSLLSTAKTDEKGVDSCHKFGSKILDYLHE